MIEAGTLRIDVTDLIDRPGATRTVARSVRRAEMETPEGGWGPGDDVLIGAIDLHLELEMLVDGLLVTGTVAFPTEMACSRCLTGVRHAEVAEVSELYQDPRMLEEEEREQLEAGYELTLATIDLETLIRDAVLAAVPLKTLCREDCAGLCAVCGTDLNVEDCGHRDEPVADPRWRKLESLDVPPG